MSTSVERAAARIRHLAADRRDAFRLARLASIAVRVDAPLLRALRRAMLPGADAGAEADLWFSSLCESASSQGFVFDPFVVDLLRRDLADEVVDGKQRALDAAWTITDRLHADLSPSLRLEERVTWLALKKDGDHAAEIESLLHQAAKAMAGDATRGLDVARWALRALPRLPDVVRETEAALLLALAASERLGGRTVLPAEDRAGAILTRAAWFLSPETLKARTRIGLRRYPDCVEFVAPADGIETIELPRTTPLYVELSWGPAGSREAHTVAAEAGRVFMLPPAPLDLRLHTLAGEEYAFDGTGAAVSAATEPMPQTDLFRACVGVRATRGAPGQEATYATGYFAGRDLVLTSASIAGSGDDTVASGGANLAVTRDGRWIGATMIATRPGSGEAMLRLEQEIPDALVLPRMSSEEAISIGAAWEGVAFKGTSPIAIRGRVSAVAAQMPPGASPRPRDAGLSMILLSLEGVASGPSDLGGFAGTPVVIGGKIAGQLELVAATGAQSMLYAIPATRLNQFVYDVLRPSEHDPIVFLSYAPRDEYRKGAEIDETAAERVKNALRAARVYPQLDTDLQQARPASLAEPISAAVNAAGGGAVFVTPVSHLQADMARLELLMLAYRRWVKADFPLSSFRFRSGGLREKRGVPPGLLDLEGPSLDKASDAEIEAYARERFLALGLLRDSGSGLARVRARLGSLLEKAMGQDTAAVVAPGSQPRSLASPPVGWTLASAVDAVISHGMAADILWDSWLRNLSQDEGREVVETAAMFSIPADTPVPLAALATSSPRADLPRAFCVNAMPINIAKAIVRRAWIGEAPPTWIAFREQVWPDLDGPDNPVRRVVDEVARALDCSTDEAQMTLKSVTSPLVLIFAPRPLPEPSYVDSLKLALPFAIFLFLDPGSALDPKVLADRGIAALPPIEMQDWQRFLQSFKDLMEIVSPRAPASNAAPSSVSRRKPKPKGKAAPRRLVKKKK
jgi:hypothetical protein